MTLDEHYICQRAANAIISEIGPFRVSTDALQAINQFLDEFIVLLLTCSLSLDLSEIKSVVFSLLPSTLGKNAIVEAELEVKTFTETESIDYELYERMRNLGSNQSKFPLNEAVSLLREKCFEYCTLADKDDQLYLQKSIRNKRNEADMKVIIPPIVAIYVTTVMEHIAEYLLTAVAMTAEHEETDYVRVKEVFLALIDDIQLGDVFNRMDLRDKMEKRAGLVNHNNRIRNSYLPPPSPSPTQNRKSYTLDQHQQETGSFLDITFDDLDLDYFDEGNHRKSTASRANTEIRPHSVMSQASNYTLNTNSGNNANRKSTFHLFKNNRNSFSGGELPRASSPVGVASVYDPDAPSMNFDDLIKSGGTVKVSLTPNRLRSIEIKDQTKEESTPPPLTWERRSTSSPRLSTVNTTPSRPSSPLVRQNTTSSVGTSVSHSKRSNQHHTFPSASGTHSSLSSSDHEIEVPKISNRPATPSSPLSKKSFSISEKNRFENPRDAPKPPPTPLQPLSPTIPVAVPKAQTTVSTPSIASKQTKVVTPVTPASHSAVKKTTTTTTTVSSPPTPLPKLPAQPIVQQEAKSRDTDSISSDISSVPSMPSPVTAVEPPVSDISSIKTSNTSTTTISIQEPPLPKPSKSNTLNANGIVIRRSSVSSKKSRENLRKAKEENHHHQKSPLVVEDPIPSKVSRDEEEKKHEEAENEIVLTEEPAQMDTTVRQVHFDTANTDDNTSSAANATEEETSPSSSVQSTEQKANESSTVGAVVPRKKAPTLSPERPSSMVAKRASMVGNNRRRSLHESYATEKYHQDILLRQRVSTVGSVSVSIKQWDDILKPEEQITVIPPAAHRRSVLRQLRQQQLQEQLQLQQELLRKKESGEDVTTTPTTIADSLYSTNNNSNAVLDKVLKFERASSLDDVAHQRVSHMPRRERFLYLQQDPSAIERKSTIASTAKKTTITPPLRRQPVVGIDQGVQTDPQPAPVTESIITPPSSIKKEDEEERGMVDGDEEWFLQDDEWDEQEETAIVEWLLGE